jgi:copper resistance protein B
MKQHAAFFAALIATASLPTALHAQDHAGHAASPTEPATAPTSPPTGGTDHDMMDHAAMGHGNDTAAATASPGPMMETPPPPEAGSGPPRAADAIWGADAMAASRKSLRDSHGNFPTLWVQGDRLETQITGGIAGYLWDVQGFYGGPTSRLWFKSEGEGAFGERVEEAEFQALYAKAIAPYWDLQTGIRQDVAGLKTTHAVIGIQGLAPYMFEVDAAIFVSHRGDITARIETELDQRITRRLILQPRAEITLSAQDIPRLGTGAGLDSVELGVRLRYELIREFAPYIGVEQSWRVGKSADFMRAAGEDASATHYIVGVRFWF